MPAAMSHSGFLDLSAFETRRQALGMSIEALAKRSGVSRTTVHRTLNGGVATLPHLVAIAKAMGLELGIRSTVEPEKFKQQAARRKAERLVGMVQGTMGLEAQAVRATCVKQMVEQTVRELLVGSKRKLWSE